MKPKNSLYYIIGTKELALLIYWSKEHTLIVKIIDTNKNAKTWFKNDDILAINAIHIS